MLKIIQNKPEPIKSAFRPLELTDEYFYITTNMPIFNNRKEGEITIIHEDKENNQNKENIKNALNKLSILEEENQIEFDENTNMKKSTKNIFFCYKRGRTRKERKIKELKIRCHDRFSFYNSTRRILHSCNQCIYEFIMKKLSKNHKIYRPTIENQLGYKIKEYNQFMKKKYYEIAKYSIPKRYKGQKLRTEKEKLTEEEKENIYKLNEIELNKILFENKELNDLFNLTFGDFLKAYINDENYINIKGTNINLIGFRTFKQCFNEKKDIYNEYQKEKYKHYIMNIINDENISY